MRRDLCCVLFLGAFGIFSREEDLKAEGVAGQGHGAEVADVVEDVRRLAFGGAEDDDR